MKNAFLSITVTPQKKMFVTKHLSFRISTLVIFDTPLFLI